MESLLLLAMAAINTYVAGSSGARFQVAVNLTFFFLLARKVIDIDFLRNRRGLLIQQLVGSPGLFIRLTNSGILVHSARRRGFLWESVGILAFSSVDHVRINWMGHS